MPQPRKAVPVDPLVERRQRIEAAMTALRPQVEAMVLKMVETVVDQPEAEELGAVEFELRDLGRDLTAAVEQAGLASRKKRGTSVRAGRVRTAARAPSSSTTCRGPS
jgi:hypothetical protein